MTPIFVRIRSRVLKTDILMNTRIEVDAFKWNSAHRSANALTNFRSTPLGNELFQKLSKIESEINLHLDQGEKLTTDTARQYIDSVIYAEQKEKGRNAKAFFLYVLVGVIGYGLTVGLTLIGTKLIGEDGIWYLIMTCFVKGLVLIWNYLGRKIFVYKGK